MKIAIRYFSKTGNTEKIANAIGKEIGVEALPMDKPLTDDVDILFLGSSVMAANPRKEVKQFINDIDVSVGKVVNFGTAAFIESTYDQVKKLVEAKGLIMAEEEFHCVGQFTFRHRNRPNEDDMRLAAEFAKGVVA